MSKQLKQLLAGQLVTALKGSDGAVFVNVAPLTVEQNSKLRNHLHAKVGGAKLRVLQNRTARAALKQIGFPDKIATVLKGPTAVVYGGEGANSIAKALADYVRTEKTLVLKGAVAEGEFFDAKGVGVLAKMPDKRTLRAMLATGIISAGRGLATTIAGPGAGLARVLQARIDKKGFAADAAS
jgi:large subunit ribosomal protein L10